jgi:hypothetical protein
VKFTGLGICHEFHEWTRNLFLYFREIRAIRGKSYGYRYRFSGSTIRGEVTESPRPPQSLLRAASKAQASEQ